MKTPLLKKEIIKIFQKYGLSKDHASISANSLINAELVGAYGHGLSRLKMYCDRISKKVINSKPKIKIKKISQSLLSSFRNDRSNNKIDTQSVGIIKEEL
mgnify:CR=1 FL=1